MIKIVARMLVKADKIEEFKATARELVEKSRAEAGNVFYHDAECPCFYQINERYPIFQLEPDDEARLMTLRNMPEQ